MRSSVALKDFEAGLGMGFVAGMARDSIKENGKLKLEIRKTNVLAQIRFVAAARENKDKGTLVVPFST
jgi:hypothetical protein